MIVVGQGRVRKTSHPMTEFATIKALLELLTLTERRRLIRLGGLLAISGMAEMIGVGVVFGYLSLLGAVAADGTDSLPQGVAWIADWPVERLALAGGLALVVVFVAKTLLIAGVYSVLMQFIFDVYQRFSVYLFRQYLKVPLIYHLTRSSSEIQRNINLQPLAMFNAAAVSLAYMAANAVAIAFLCAILAAIDLNGFLLAFAVLVLASGSFYAVFRYRLTRLGRQRFLHQAGTVRWVAQAVGGIREIRLAGSEGFFERQFADQLRVLAQADRSLRTTTYLPGLANQVTLVIGLVGIILLYVGSGRNVPDLLPTLAAFGVAGVRIMGMVGSMVTHAQQLQFQGPGIHAMRALVDGLDSEIAAGAPPKPGESLPFRREVALQSVSFSYPNTLTLALDRISLAIPRGGRVAIVGPSGSGKSTLGLILTGLLEPTTGAALVDGVPMGGGRKDWFRRIAYVPQSIFILDDTVRANVLFGAEQESDDVAIWTALELAQIAGKIRSLPKGLDTPVGDSGALLSGGERQRLGIARALYRRPEILVLDEATSAIDGPTERLLVDAIVEHFRDLTIVTIAHRVSMARRSEMILYMEEGRIVESGTLDELVDRSPAFRHLIAL